MEVWRSLAEVPTPQPPSVATIGIFDGVHAGHRYLLERLVERARAQRYRAVALTFHPHPRAVHHPEVPFTLISSLADRLTLLRSLHLDAVLVENYTLEFAQLSPEEFVRLYFVEGLNAKELVVGQDVRFGKGNAGDLQMLIELGQKYGFEVHALPDQQDPLTHRRYSSTWIRDLLFSGDVAKAAEILGYPHRVRGVVVPGEKRGRRLGFPTANLAANGAGEVPADGVYAGWLVRHLPVGSPRPTTIERLPAAISVGMNPQFQGTMRTVEAHVLGRGDLNLYGEEVAIEFVDRLRPMLTFDSVEALQDQIDKDLQEASAILRVPPAHRLDPAEVTAP